MSREGDSQRFTPTQRTGLDARRVDQDRTLDSMHRLEATLGSPAPGRESAWLQDVVDALGVLDGTTRAEQRNADQADSLLSDIARTQPRLRNRVRALRVQYRNIRDTIAALRQELAGETDVPADFVDIRQRLAWLVTALRHQRARESDLIYEAYYDAFDTDIETELPG